MIKDAILWQARDERKVACSLCAHRCTIAQGKLGICGVRRNDAGKLVTLVYGEVIAAHVDPIEKKPFHHFLPGTTSFSIATVGCNFRCSFCQNWEISQARAGDAPAPPGSRLMPEEVVREALARGCRSVSYTYTEPTIFFEYAADTARLARARGLRNAFVTNGYMTAEALEAASPWLDAANVDLKAFKDETYRKICQARLEPVLATVRLMKKLGVWVEITTLIVPGLNDSEDEIADIARFIAGVDPDIPWHISRFHSDYEYADVPATPVRTLEKALAIGKKEGLRHIYVGNVPGGSEDTMCPVCGRRLVRRRDFRVDENRIRDSKCPDCGTRIAGVF
ncbi:MAG: AmmeMemoRadiSam system radical SAM enzyme [Candidatus Aminicenantales bacterium]